MKTKCGVSVGNEWVFVCVHRRQTYSKLSFNTCVGGFQGRFPLFWGWEVSSVYSLSKSQLKTKHSKHWLTWKQSEAIIPLTWQCTGVCTYAWQTSLFRLVPYTIHETWRTLGLGTVLALYVGGANFLCAIAAAEVQPIELRAVASFHWQWLNHNILSTDMLSHGIQLWPIAKQQGYLWLSLIGWSLSTKLKGHIPGTQPEAETGSSLLALYFTLSFL